MSNSTIPSDNLYDLRELFLKWQPFFRLLEVIPQFRLVIDTNVVIEELLYLVKSRKNQSARTSLQEAIDSGAVVALAPFKLRDEIIKHIPRLAEERGVPEESLRRAWLEYQLRINFVDVGPISAEDETSAVDPDDLPFVYLYRKVNADAVVSRDRHIRAMGARSIELEVVIHIRDYARAKAPEVTLKAGAFIVTMPLAAGVHALVKLLIRAAKGIANLPPGVQLALLAGAAVVSAHPRSRRALSTFASERVVKLKGPALVALSVLQSLMEQLNAAEQQVWTKQEILERSIPRAAKRPLRSVARSVCLGAGSALTVDELTRGVFRAGYESSSNQFKYYLLRVLRDSEEFVCTADGRWTVRSGREVAAAT
jgi:predicted nucleic acid-binding protein